MSTQHTSTPLSVDFVRGSYVIHGNNLPVANVCRGSWALERAAHIVRCVNSHDALVEAVKYLLDHEGDFTDAGVSKCRAAIKAATEQS